MIKVDNVKEVVQHPVQADTRFLFSRPLATNTRTNQQYHYHKNNEIITQY